MIGWKPYTTSSCYVAYSPVDVERASGSGSVRIYGRGAGMCMVSQCVPSDPGQLLTFGGWIRTASDSVQAPVSAVALTAFEGVGCQRGIGPEA